MGDWRTRLANFILQCRLENPDLPWHEAHKRRRRVGWEKDTLVIVAMDHPARRVVAAGGSPFAMADRLDLLRRTAHVLMQPGVDGLLATPDVMEELFILGRLFADQGMPNFMDGKVLVGSINRGGLAGTAFELDDFITAYTPQGIQSNQLDAGKLLLRLDPAAPDSGQTIRYCVDAIAELARLKLPIFLEPLAVPHSTDDLVRLVGVASALGPTSARRWMKLPMTDDFERVAAATTCPILLLGGHNPGSPTELLGAVERCMEKSPNVRGMMVGRGILYPTDGSNPASAALQLAAQVHGDHVKEVVPWPEQMFTHWDV